MTTYKSAARRLGSRKADSGKPEVNVLLAYALCACGMFGLGGLHRFYLGRPVSGLLWLLTGGLFGFGTFIDLFLIPSMAKERNLYLWSGTRTDSSLDLVDLGRQTLELFSSGTSPAASSSPSASEPPPLTPIQQLLHAAESRNNVLSLGKAVMITGLEPEEAQEVLMEAVRRGLAHIENDSETGAVRYHFDI
ncbi:TM2 domain-containing protein [Romeria aff. gracilis LEGE 07310]|uniref:TM2 domain-containing protein n=1 Tax=Vasconcelosia minhoensis LEGE 07310 TaxID=915328 RepID=A0A8J7DSI3_9CYAN|nr:NINE protein [Romeria gracilis]MBE9080329.1 TM2 domain-containing protein [Romeria aff. gracilis LEGE 07310]